MRLLTFAVLTLMACGGPQQYVPELCGDGVDNDENGKTDCADDFCKAEAACQVNHGSCAKCGQACTKQTECFETSIFNEPLPLPLCRAGVCEQLATVVRPKANVDTSEFTAVNPSFGKTGTIRFISKTAVNGSAVTCAALETLTTAADGGVASPDVIEVAGGFNVLGLDVTRLDSSWVGTLRYPLLSAQTSGPYLTWLELWSGYADSNTKYATGRRSGHSCFESAPDITTEILADYNCPSTTSDAGSCHVYSWVLHSDL